jgi:uncharacterized protein (UPF0332 family)
LSYNPRRFLEIARRLLKDSNYESKGRTRTAIGRAYYAAFLLSKQKLERASGPFRNVHKLHESVIERFMEIGRYDIGNRLSELFDYRVDADYYMRSKITPKLGELCIMLSEDIMNLLKTI